MNKLVMAALLATASLTGLHGSAHAFQLFPNVQFGQKAQPAPAPKAEVQMVQATDPTLRVQQLEEEIRALNGRIEEMSFQLLQMQETIRKQQEDNEFRFQDLEKKSGSLTRPVDGGQQQDSVAEIITETPDVGATADASGVGTPGTAPGEQTYQHGRDRYYDGDYRRGYRGDYRSYRNYYDEPAYRSSRAWRGDNGRYYCRKKDGTTGLLIGGAAGALLGREIDSRGDRTVGTLLGAVGGALLGREVDRGNSRCR